MTGRRTAEWTKPPRTGPLAGCVTAFASAVKNLTIYPRSHPRVVARADEFVQFLAAIDAGDLELAVHTGGLRVHGADLAADHLAVQWLAQRCREAGVRAIAIASACRPDDVLSFGEALAACRPGSGQSLPQIWPSAGARVRPLELVVGERRSARATAAPDGTPPPAGPPAVPDVPSDLRSLLQRIAERPQVRSLIEALAEAGGDDVATGSTTRQVDLLGVIGARIPADAPTELEPLAATIEQILSRTLEDAIELARCDSQVRGADLMRSAVQVAQTYFGRSDVAPPPSRALPSGRPEDDSIAADLPALLDELRALPAAEDLRLPPAHELDLGAPTIDRELLGICLHGLADATSTERRAALLRWVASTATRAPDGVDEVLHAYLGPRSALPQHTRLRILSGMHAADLVDTVRRGGYLDDDLLRGGFPEVLALAARTFREPDDFRRLRLALDDIAPLLDNGGADAAADAGHLDADQTIRLLARTGGRAALQLLARSRNREGLRDAMVECARDLGLPDAERIALERNLAERLPRTYQERLLQACADGEFPSALRATTAEILSSYLRGNLRTVPAAELADAVDALEQIPCAQTRTCLEALARAGRFSLSADLRALRQRARDVLDRAFGRARS